MNVSVFAGDLTEAPADIVCTSTNPRLSLMMGTGASVRERGGFAILRACEAIVSASGPLPPGSVHRTTAGSLPHRFVLHCVASDATHRSSPEVITACVINALAMASGCRSIAMPVFGSGHARVRFDVAVSTIASALSRASTALDVVIAVNDLSRAQEAAALLSRVTRLPVALTGGGAAEREEHAGGWWDNDDRIL